MQGVVIIEATIGADGTVQDAKVLRSIPLLDAAALDAVQAVGVHADDAQRAAGAGHHDGHRQLHAAVVRTDAAIAGMARCADRVRDKPGSAWPDQRNSMEGGPWI